MKARIGVMCGCMALAIGSALCHDQDLSKSLDVNLCDLYQHPEEYSGKIVRVRGGSVGGLWIENIFRDAPTTPCPAYMTIVVVFPHQVKPAPGFDLVRDESLAELEQGLHRARPMHIDATYEGRFDPLFVHRDGGRFKVGHHTQKGYGKNHFYDARIVLHRVSDVWTLPLPGK